MYEVNKKIICNFLAFIALNASDQNLQPKLETSDSRDHFVWNDDDRPVSISKSSSSSSLSSRKASTNPTDKNNLNPDHCIWESESEDPCSSSDNDAFAFCGIEENYGDSTIKLSKVPKDWTIKNYHYHKLDEKIEDMKRLGNEIGSQIISELKPNSFEHADDYMDLSCLIEKKNQDEERKRILEIIGSQHFKYYYLQKPLSYKIINLIEKYKAIFEEIDLLSRVNELESSDELAMNIADIFENKAFSYNEEKNNILENDNNAFNIMSFLSNNTLEMYDTRVYYKHGTKIDYIKDPSLEELEKFISTNKLRAPLPKGKNNNNKNPNRKNRTELKQMLQNIINDPNFKVSPCFNPLLKRIINQYKIAAKKVDNYQKLFDDISKKDDSYTIFLKNLPNLIHTVSHSSIGILERQSFLNLSSFNEKTRNTSESSNPTESFNLDLLRSLGLEIPTKILLEL